MISVDGYCYYCCEICNESYAYVHIKEDGKELWVSSYIDADDGISVSELREEVRWEFSKETSMFLKSKGSKKVVLETGSTKNAWIRKYRNKPFL